MNFGFPATRKRRFAGICHKLRKETIKFESYLATYRFFPGDRGPRKKFERKKKKMTCRNDSDDSARLHIGRQISYGFRCFRLRSSKWDSLPAHVLMKLSTYQQINAFHCKHQCTHIIIYLVLQGQYSINLIGGFHFWICSSVCLSVCPPASLPACVCVCVLFFLSKFFDTDLKIQPLLYFIFHWTTVLTIDFCSLSRAKYRSQCSLTSVCWRSLPKV